ncbi:hypothetical protein [Psychrobacter namhaensis]|uniref:hypothetical protein n=1 Tax=Psychrobacter namhaensis TaxID=292734 RepID=UPI0019186EF0|nr:hypothetical protein [Psychrobacter namhaensis]
MSNILLDERLIAFIPSLASEIGTNEAIVLQQINYWIQKSNKVYDGKRWVYNTTKEWVEKEFCFMSESTLKRTITNLKKMGLIESKKLSKHTGYHINYYTINNAKVQEIDAKIKQRSINEIQALENSIGSDCTVIGSDCTNEQVRLTQSGLGQNDTTITESTSRLLTDIKGDSENKKKTGRYQPVKPEAVSIQVWMDLLEHRKSKKASDSQTAWTRIFNSLEKAQAATKHDLNTIIGYWLMRDWKGFDDDWYINAHANQTKQQTANRPHSNRSDSFNPSSGPKLTREQQIEKNKQAMQQAGLPV